MDEVSVYGGTANPADVNASLGSLVYVEGGELIMIAVVNGSVSDDVTLDLLYFGVGGTSDTHLVMQGHVSMMRIDESIAHNVMSISKKTGNVGINVHNPMTKLEVSGGARFKDGHFEIVRTIPSDAHADPHTGIADSTEVTVTYRFVINDDESYNFVKV
jgi:hypothetical protein